MSLPYCSSEAESDEEDKREYEALLYSQIHHEANPDYLQEENRDAKAFSDSGVVSSTPSPVTNICTEEEKPVLENQQTSPDIVVLKGQKRKSEPVVVELSSSSDDEDEGIQVLEVPQRATSTHVIPDCFDISSDSSALELEEILSKADPEEPKSKKFKAETKPKLFVVKETTPKREISRKRRFSSSSESSSEGGDDLFSLSNLNLNILGSKTPRDQGNNFFDIIGKNEGDDLNAICGPVPKSWNESMAAFYNDIDTKAGDSTIESVFDAIETNSKDDWKIDRADLYRDSFSGGRRSSGRYCDTRKRCSNCNQTGHYQRDCPKPKKTTCLICSSTNHPVDLCSRSLCLRCGSSPKVRHQRQPFLTQCKNCRNWDFLSCSRCGAPGHHSTYCPDEWRRYHATTSDGRIVVPESDVHKDAAHLSCPNCSKKGHYLHHCRAYRSSPFPFPILQVISYGDKRNERKMKKEALKAAQKAYRRSEDSFPTMTRKDRYVDFGTRNLKNSRRSTMRSNRKKPHLNLSAVSGKRRETLEIPRHVTAYDACMLLQSRGKNKRAVITEMKRLQESLQPHEKLSKKAKRRVSNIVNM